MRDVKEVHTQAPGVCALNSSADIASVDGPLVCSFYLS